MAMTMTGSFAKSGLPPIEDSAMACIEGLIDTAFWQLMLGGDLEICQRDIDMLCAGLKFRMAQIWIAAKNAEDDL